MGEQKLKYTSSKGEISSVPIVTGEFDTDEDEEHTISRHFCPRM